jgi:hypothetical protein
MPEPLAVWKPQVFPEFLVVDHRDVVEIVIREPSSGLIRSLVAA